MTEQAVRDKRTEFVKKLQTLKEDVKSLAIYESTKASFTEEEQKELQLSILEANKALVIIERVFLLDKIVKDNIKFREKNIALLDKKFEQDFSTLEKRIKEEKDKLDDSSVKAKRQLNESYDKHKAALESKITQDHILRALNDNIDKIETKIIELRTGKPRPTARDLIKQSKEQKKI